MSDLRKLYDAHFQTNVVAFILRDATFLGRVANELQPEMFSDENVQRIVRIILDFWKTDRSAPGTNIFRLLDAWNAKGGLNDATKEVCAAICDSLFAIKLQNQNFLLAQFDEFLQHQAFETTLPTVVELVRRGEFEEAKQKLNTTFTDHRIFAGNSGVYFDADVSRRIANREVQDRDRLAFLIPPLDGLVKGSVPGELCVWQSQKSSAGKSAAMVQQARNYAIQGANVAILSLEMGQQAYEDRFDQCIAGLTREEIRDDFLLRMRIESYCRRATGKILIKKFPAYTTRSSTLREYVKFQEAMVGIKFNAILIDYADLLAPETQSLRGDLYASGAEVYSYLSGWASTENVHMWTAMQSGRDAANEQFADQHHAGGSIAKMQIADMVLSINRNADLVKEHKTRIHVVKNRNGKASFDILLFTDFERMQFWSARLDPDWERMKVP